MEIHVTGSLCVSSCVCVCVEPPIKCKWAFSIEQKNIGIIIIENLFLMTLNGPMRWMNLLPILISCEAYIVQCSMDIVYIVRYVFCISCRMNWTIFTIFHVLNSIHRQSQTFLLLLKVKLRFFSSSMDSIRDLIEYWCIWCSLMFIAFTIFQSIWWRWNYFP